jgi:5-methylcytosine-specific restriction endonuclease McrA
VEFYTQDQSARASWRLAVLMGKNSRTYKFALADALLHFAAQGREEVMLAHLAAAYALQVVRHLELAPQGPQEPVAPSDFLHVAQSESQEVHRTGQPTDRLVTEAVRNMPSMVMQKFHNVPGGEVRHRFYAVIGRGAYRVVTLTPDLRRIAASEQYPLLRRELAARWSIVETSFATGIGASLVTNGMLVDLSTMDLTDTRRRRSVTGVHDAVIGFQHGRCLICDDDITERDRVAVDHVYPYALMRRAAWTWSGPDLDAVWNLASAHYDCNAMKSDSLPTTEQRRRLALRNQAILDSPQPLSRTLRGTLARAGVSPGSSSSWNALFAQVGF